MLVFIMGPAGVGKTTLTHKLGNWIKRNIDTDVGFVNLDPAVEFLPYNADVDARSIIDARELMIKEKLGPNGALLKAIEILEKNLDDLVIRIKELRRNYVIIDTPGQLDMFIFHDFGEKIVSALQEYERSVGIFLWEPSMLISPINAATLFLLTIIVRFRLNIPVVPAVSKIDLIGDQYRSTFYDSLAKIKEKLDKEAGAVSELISNIYTVLKEYSIPTRIIGVSSEKEIGFDLMYGLLKEVFCVCGDLT
ncbi:MAG: hypothetical protein GU361_06675 [Desulfurococcales archaeon]|jgi:GTPase SAR1 family protein|nr:hypothetical protein [Desulfurococcales archaeon]